MTSELDWLTQRLVLIEQLGLTIDVQPQNIASASSPPGWVVASVRLCDQTYAMHLDDEYGDLAYQYPPLSLEVLLRTCLDYQDFDTGLEWGRAVGFTGTISELISIWDTGNQVASTLLPEASGIEAQISDLDWQLNSGLAFELRKRNAINDVC